MSEVSVLLVSPMVKSFLAGSLSGTCSTILFQPLDLVKTRLQIPILRSSHYSMFSVVSHVIRTENVSGLWKGMTPSIVRCVPGVGMYFCCLHWLKSNFGSDQPSSLESLVLGASARCIAGISLLPITVIKTRFESGQYPYKSMGAALKKIYKTEGIKGLYSGMSATLLRDAPFSGIYLMFYTNAKNMVPKEKLNSTISPIFHFGCGVTAGILASCATHPADVIKTKMQLYPDKFRNTPKTIVFIYQKYGLPGYFRGLAPRMLRRTLMTAMAWTVYEQLMKSLGL